MRHAGRVQRTVPLILAAGLVLASCGDQSSTGANGLNTTTRPPAAPSLSTTSETAGGLPTSPGLDAQFPTEPDLEAVFPEEAPLHPATDTPACEGSVRLTGSHFETARWELVPEAEETLTAALEELLAYTDDWKVVVYGHTDARPFNGLPGGNRELSRRRAQGVADWLIAEGLDAGRIEDVIGVGADMPLDEGDTNEAHARNRRVEIIRYCAAGDRPAP